MATGTPTPNLGLLVWNGSDKVLRTEENQNFSIIDTFAGSAVKLSNTSPFTANQTAPAWIASGLTGAQGTGRWVGITTQAGAPTSGTFAKGDFVIDPFTPAVWICESAGTPGTWANSVGTQYGKITGVRNQQITSTSATQLFTFTPTVSGLYTVKAYLRVVTAATNITLTTAYADSGGAQSYTPAALNNTSVAVNSHGIIDYTFEAVAGTPITLTITCGTSNQVYATASLVGVA